MTRVALDGTPLAISSGGLRRYTEELLHALREEYPSDRFEALEGGARRLWWSVRLPFQLLRRGFQLFHGTNFEVPYIPVTASVMSVHDVSPWLNPEWHHGAGRVRSRARALIQLGIPTMLLTGTEAVKRQIVELFAVHADRVAVVPDAARIESLPFSSTRPYFLYVGTIEPRKNVPALVRAWQAVRERHDVDLIIAGRRREDGPELPAEPGLAVVGEVSDDHLARLYSGALALVYPSLYEGFGLPVVEAMRCGTPVIASRDPALVEVSSGAAIHAGPDELAEAMDLIARCPGERVRRARAGVERAAYFTWARTARLTREVYEEAIRRHRVS